MGDSSSGKPDVLQHSKSSPENSRPLPESSTIFVKSSRSIKLTRSKLFVLEIPGKEQLESKCECSACIDKERYEASLPKPCKVKDMDAEENPAAAVMNNIYTNMTTDSRLTTKAAYAKSIANMQLPGWESFKGRRIVDYDFFMKWLVLSQASHSRLCMGLLCPQQEQFQSMISTIWMKCNVCGLMLKGSSEMPSNNPTKLRFSLAWAILCSGTTYNLAYELFSFLDIPIISSKTYFLDEARMDSVLENALEESTYRAGEEELKLTKEENKSLGLPEDTPAKIVCEIDGSWAQRSNGTRFTSSSGCAAIVGSRSKRVLHVGMRNKRCSVCSQNIKRAKMNRPLLKHKCYKNFTGSSGAMESSIIVEGFKLLLRRGIKCGTIITDGDSTTVYKVKNQLSYGREIGHQLCCNHTLKGTGKKLREVI